ncbi:hypothetical protein [Streptomyces sp. NPDC056188]|uniref:hypothetical protein n=1 Tax=Streptomyces sp. NPDC056188 TaxID=3345740 RepID=UPI0035E0B411
MAAGADAEGDMVNCEQTREEPAVQALLGYRHGGLDAEHSVHLGHCAECSAERQRLADVTLLLQSVGLCAFEELPSTGAGTAPRRTPGPHEAAADARDHWHPRAGRTRHGTADRMSRATGPHFCPEL